MPLHMHPYYKETYGFKTSDFPKAAALFDEILSLPIYSDISVKQIRLVVEAIKQAISGIIT